MEENNNVNSVTSPEKKGFFSGKIWSFLWELAKIAIVALVIVLPIRYFLFQPFIVKGESMSPNFESGDYLIVDEISYKFSGLQRGDVVVFDYPKDTTQRFIKRLIGLPGETVEIQNGKVDIVHNGQTMLLNETYLPNNLQTIGNIDVTLKPGEYFMMGDNRDYSFDSRSWGTVPQSDIIGRAALRLFPLNKIAEIAVPTY